jgi:hypothetical protein
MQKVATIRLSTKLVLSVIVGLTGPSMRLGAQLINLSSRVLVAQGKPVIGGLVITGSSNETLLVRAVGPSLQSYGISNPLPDPSLIIYDSEGKAVAGPITNWSQVSAATMAGVGAFALQENSNDAAVVVTLPPGNYTANVSSASGDSGVVLLEADQMGDPGSAQLTNLSSRASVSGAANGSVVTGFVIAGTGARTLLIRAVGPTLGQFDVSDALQQPSLELMNQQGVSLAENDSWGTPLSGGASAAQLQAAFAQSGAFSLAAGSSDSAVLVTLQPGSYTVNVSGVSGGSGSALAEVYDVTGPAATPAAPTAPGSPNTPTTPAAPIAPATPTTPTAPTALNVDTVWYQDAVPAGAQQISGAGGEGWTWITSNPSPVAGTQSHQSLLAAGLHDHFFNYASATLSVATGDQLFAYVYLNPANPPSEIMLSWNDGTSWEHRAYWGADTIAYGSDNTPGRVSMGPLPATGQWVRLEVSASQVGAVGMSLAGMGFSTYGGQATYGYAGASAQSSFSPGTPVTAPVTGGSTGGSGTSGTGSSGTGSGSGSGSTSGSGSVAIGVISGTTGTDTSSRASDPEATGDNVDDTALQLPDVGDNQLHIISPSVLELVSITTKQPDPAPVSKWNFVGANGEATEPSPSEFTVTIGGKAVAVQAVGFKRRVMYAPLNSYDLRIQNCLYLQIASPVADGQAVAVTNPDGTLWPSSTLYAASCSPQRYSPAIHVNQEGYVPSFAKQAMVGYYLGDMGELAVNPNAGFNIIDAATGSVVFSGILELRLDTGYETTPVPYQQVYVADFSAFTVPGQYQLQVPGMGASLPFLIDDGIAMAWTRTYAHGMYTQRSGTAVSLPYTRFTHAADHTAPAAVPSTDGSAQFAFTWNCISGYATTVNSDNPAQTAPFLTSNAKALYPFVNTGTIDVSGGHFDAGDYSKYTINSAQLTHELIFAVDNIPGLKTFDNLGIPESGDGIPDVLQEAKWEADFLAKMQDADGGFYFLVYPLNREYESNVLPENGDSQVVWPKTTSVTAAAVAALAEAGSSPTMIKYYPQAAAKYMQEAQLGWQFLMNAIAKYGLAGSYQKITFYGDDWTHSDELAWAASAMYAATGNAQYQAQLFQWFPNPADTSTFRWGWWNMSEGWGNAIRTYAFAARSGRLPASALTAGYLAACEAQVVAGGDNAVGWGSQCAYGTPFPPATKAVLGGGWYFSLDQASDMAVAYQIDPKPAYIDGLVAAMNYEGGNNPVNVTYVEGLGQKREQQSVSQYAQNSRRVLSPTGDTIGQVTAGFEYLNSYGSELSELSYPTDSGNSSPYPYYDRWSDAYNVTTEQITVNQARSLISVGFLASLTGSSATAWTAPNATITVPSAAAQLNAPVTLSVQVPGMDLSNSRIVWEARDQLPAYGPTYTISPVNNGDQWVEAEVEWPDGRRAFAEADFQAGAASQVWIDDALPANAVTATGGGDSWSWVSASPAAHSGSYAFQSGIASGEHDMSFTGSTGGMDDDVSTVGLSGSMAVGAGDTLFAWVYLDPANPPTEIMLGWYDGSSWEHRAFWGADSIAWGSDGTTGRSNMGALPAAGGWVELKVPASAVGLGGAIVSGMDFAAFGGRVTWDTVGRSSSN